jgi:hypothetical protein
LEQHAFACSDLCTRLTHTLERPGYFFLVAARHAIREHVHVETLVKQIQGRLKHANVRLHLPCGDQPCKLTEIWRRYLNAHEDEGLELVCINQVEELGCCHRKKCLFDRREM